MVSKNGPLTWGILGVGRISNDFVTALKILPKSEHKVLAVAARNESKAKEFASQHEIPKSFGGYEDLLTDPEIEVVYIGLINFQHYNIAKLALSKGKHVLCEKPLCLNAATTKDLADIAKEKGVFLMEGIWSRCFPIYDKLREELNKKSVGDVLQVYASLGCPLSAIDNCRLKSMGGGSLLNLGIYCVQFATFVFGEEMPEKVLAGGHLNEDGVDESISITLVYKGGRTATLISHLRTELMNDAFVVGTEGMLKLPAMFVCPKSLIIIIGEEEVKFDLPNPAPGSHFNYPGSEGLSYEAQEVRKCIRGGLLQSPKMTWRDSILVAEIMEKALKQLGVSYN